MSGVVTRDVPASAAGQRLDRWFKEHYPELPFGQLQKLLRSGQVRLDGKRVKGSARLEAGQSLRIPPLGLEAKPESAKSRRPEPDAKAAKALRDRVLLRDDWLIAIDKPAGLAVQGGTGQSQHLDGLLGALRFDAVAAPKLVHRLDRDTSGVLLLARHGEAARRLGTAFHDKTTRKIYWALVAGRAPKPRGVISLALGKSAGPGGEKVRPGAGQEATTLYQVVAQAGRKASWLLLMPLTGRTHQLRVHCAALDMPILGDGKYGGRGAFLEKPALPKSLMLHARELALPHPDDGTTFRVSAPPPLHMEEALAALRFDPAEGEAALHGFYDYAANFTPAEAALPETDW